MMDKHNSNEKRRSERPTPDLGQKEAALEKVSDEQLSHMDGGKPARTDQQKKTTVTREK
jgi:hypothetical protein